MAVMTQDFRIADFYTRTLNDSGFTLFSAEQVEEFARSNRFPNRIIELTLTSQEITGTPLPDSSNTNNGVYFEFIGKFEDINRIYKSSTQYGLSQTNVYVNEILNNNCYVDEIAVAVLFPASSLGILGYMEGPVVIRGYVVNLSEMLAEIFEAIASNYAKLAIAQRMLDLSTDLTQARQQALAQARYYRGVQPVTIEYVNQK